MQAEHLAGRYYGDLAGTYDAEREQTPLWKNENEAVGSVLRRLRPSTVIDVPVGTGRFFPLYQELGIQATGIDASAEMLGHAEAKARQMDLNVTLRQGDIRQLPYDDATFDAAVCMRLFNWLEPDDVVAAVQEMARVARVVVFGFRGYAPLSTLNILSGESTREHLLQLKWRFYQWRTRSESIHHEPSTLRRATAGLVMRQKVPITTRKRGTDYAVYEFSK